MIKSTINDCLHVEEALKEDGREQFRCLRVEWFAVEVVDAAVVTIVLSIVDSS